MAPKSTKQAKAHQSDCQYSGHTTINTGSGPCSPFCSRTPVPEGFLQPNTLARPRPAPQSCPPALGPGSTSTPNKRLSLLASATQKSTPAPSQPTSNNNSTTSLSLYVAHTPEANASSTALPATTSNDLLDSLPPTSIYQCIITPSDFASQPSNNAYFDLRNLVLLPTVTKLLVCYDISQNCKYNVLAPDLSLSEFKAQLAPDAPLGITIETSGDPWEDVIVYESKGKTHVSDAQGTEKALFALPSLVRRETDGTGVVLVIDETRSLFRRWERRKADAVERLKGE